MSRVCRLSPLLLLSVLLVSGGSGLVARAPSFASSAHAVPGGAATMEQRSVLHAAGRPLGQETTPSSSTLWQAAHSSTRPLLRGDWPTPPVIACGGSQQQSNATLGCVMRSASTWAEVILLGLGLLWLLSTLVSASSLTGGTLARGAFRLLLHRFLILAFVLLLVQDLPQIATALALYLTTLGHASDGGVGSTGVVSLFPGPPLFYLGSALTRALAQGVLLWQIGRLVFEALAGIPGAIGFGRRPLGETLRMLFVIAGLAVLAVFTPSLVWELFVFLSHVHA